MADGMSIMDRLRLEDLRREGEDLEFGVVEIGAEACVGCGICARACPASALELYEKKARMIEVLPMCMSCGDCVAICPEDAIEIARYISFKKAFRYLGRGEALPPRFFG